MQIGVIFGLLFGFIIAFFAILNTETVILNYYFGAVETSVALLVLASAICGALAIGLLGFLKQIRAGFAIWDFQNKSRRLNKEVEALKEQKSALADDLSFLQAEYENRMREKESECEDLVRLKEEELESIKEQKKTPDSAVPLQAGREVENDNVNGADAETEKQPGEHTNSEL
ncbi:MAG: DUF1049 domain-containing protein [Dethiobacter sp.]|jgi:uncharacterized integral membrane protein|nr:DUF1049 domain-containing protein [Dethiobacter sp.]